MSSQNSGAVSSGGTVLRSDLQNAIESVPTNSVDSATVEPTVSPMNQGTNAKVIDHGFEITVEYTVSRGQLVKIINPNDPIFRDWATAGYKVYMIVKKAGTGEWISGTSMRAEAAQSLWQAINAGKKSPIPIPMAHERENIVSKDDISNILKRISADAAGA